RSREIEGDDCAARRLAGQGGRAGGIREHTGGGRGDGEVHAGGATVVVDRQRGELIHGRLVRDLHIELSGRRVVERGDGGADGDAQAGDLRGQGNGGRG